MDFQPLGDRVVIREENPDDVSSGGIIIPDTAQRKNYIGEVIAVGPGKRTDAGDMVPMEITVGLRVCYAKYGGSQLKIEGAEYTVVRQDDIIGVMAPVAPKKIEFPDGLSWTVPASEVN